MDVMGYDTTPTPVQVISNSPNEESNERDQDIQQDGHWSPLPWVYSEYTHDAELLALLPLGPPRQLHPVNSGHRKAQLRRRLTRPGRWMRSPRLCGTFRLTCRRCLPCLITNETALTPAANPTERC
jgi:hypothetical protein